MKQWVFKRSHFDISYWTVLISSALYSAFSDISLTTGVSWPWQRHYLTQKRFV